MLRELSLRQKNDFVIKKTCTQLNIFFKLNKWRAHGSMGKGRTGKGRVSPYSLGNALRNIKNRVISSFGNEPQNRNFQIET